nr:hypothetical protein Ccrd_001133 [Tanacetum cinerariifolium]
MELVDSESAGLEESGATRIFNGFESLLIPGGWLNSMEFAIKIANSIIKKIRKGATIWHQISGGVERAVVRSEKPSKNNDCLWRFPQKDPLVLANGSQLQTLQDISGRPPLIVYEQNTSPKASKGVIQMDQEKIRSVLDWEVPKNEKAGSSGRERQDGFKENVETPSVWSARPAELAAEEIRIDQLKIEECTLWT